MDKIKIEKVGAMSTICIEGLKGDGTAESPIKKIMQFYLLTGEFIGEISATIACNHIESTEGNLFSKNQKRW